MDQQQNEPLLDRYHAYFEAIEADTPELENETYRLRYHVYCMERGFENPHDFPDGLEKDRYDQRSRHALLIHKPTSHIAGTVRLILPDPAAPAGSLPIDEVCDVQQLVDPADLPRAHTAEISRFAISRSYRRRTGEAESETGITPESLAAFEAAQRDMVDRRLAPHLILGLIAALVRFSEAEDISHWCCVMERSLLRLLGRVAIYFEYLGPEVECHGKRQPCYAHLGSLLHRVNAERPDVWSVLTENGRIQPPR